MDLIVTNAFSINMMFCSMSLSFTKITEWEARGMLHDRDFVSAVGHADTAALFSNILGQPIPMNRTTVHLNPQTMLLVGQYKGPRLAEGCHTLPEGATIEWWVIEQS